MKEIEYKFLLEHLPRAAIDNEEKIYIEQFYFDKNESNDVLKILKVSSKEVKMIDTVRIRVEHNKTSVRYILNAKTQGQKERLEFEKEVDKTLAKKILKRKIVGKIQKIRCKIHKNDYIFEFDEYLNKNKGLCVCEVEVNKNNDNYKLIIEILNNYFKVSFVDVTNNLEFKNKNLSKGFVYENYK